MKFNSFTFFFLFKQKKLQKLWELAEVTTVFLALISSWRFDLSLGYEAILKLTISIHLFNVLTKYEKLNIELTSIDILRKKLEKTTKTMENVYFLFILVQFKHGANNRLHSEIFHCKRNLKIFTLTNIEIKV